MRVVLLEQAQERFSRDLDRLIAEVQALRLEVQAVRTDLAEVKGYVRALPTTLQLLGFIITIFVAAGVTRYFGH